MFRRSTSTRSKVIGLTILAVFALSLYLAFTAIDGVPLYPYRYVTADFQNVGDLAAHNDVRVAGGRVGQVASISFKHGVAEVRMQIQPRTKVYANASATVGAQSVLGEEYVSLDPGSSSAGPLHSHTISESRTTPPVEIDQILNILQPKEANAAAAFIQTLGGALGGQQDNISTILSDYPSLLPNMGTTTATLADPGTNLVGLFQASNLLASRFQGRTQQLAQLVGQMSTTFKALDTEGGRSLQATIADADPTLPALTPALNTLAGVASNTRQAVADLRPGLAATGAGTPNLQALLVDGVSPLSKVPAVGRESLPGLTALASTFKTAQGQFVSLVDQVEAQADPILSYLEPYAPTMTELWNNLASNLNAQSDENGTWLRLTPEVDSGDESFGLSAGTTICRDAYPAPGTANGEKVAVGGTCPS